MSLKDEYLQSLYKTEAILKETKDQIVEVVKNTQTGELLVKKTVTDNSLGEVYQFLKSINHDNIVQVVDVFDVEETLVVIEEYIPGKTMQECLQNPVEEKVAIQWIEQISSALMLLHNQSPPLIHRDLKPSNIMIQRGQAILIDFDISRSVRQDANNDTRLMGTSGYAPPEQYGFAQTDARSDIYALGIILKECLQGKTAKWEAIIKKCTALDPKNRYQTVEEVIAAIKGRKRHFINIPILAGVILLIGIIVWGTFLWRMNNVPVQQALNPGSLAPPIDIDNRAKENQTNTTLEQKKDDDLPDSNKLDNKKAEELVQTTTHNNHSLNVTEKERIAFNALNNEFYQQIKEFQAINTEADSVIQEVKEGKMSRNQAVGRFNEASRQISLLQERAQALSYKFAQYRFFKKLNGVTSNWDVVLSSYDKDTQSVASKIMAGNFDEAESTLSHANTKANNNLDNKVMSEYKELQEIFN